MIARLRMLGKMVLGLLQVLGRSGTFVALSLFRIPNIRKGAPLLIKQLYMVGVLSLPIIVVSGIFIGMVLSLQGYTILVDFGAEQAVGTMLALSLTRELGPVVTGLLFAGRAGSSLTAEIGLMKATEQITSMEMLSVDPLRYVIAPRLLAGFIAMPILALIFNAVGIWGGYLVSVEWLSVDSGSFWSNMQGATEFGEDVLNGIIKTVVFAFVVSWIAVFQGFDAVPTSEGIGRATTKTVVYGSLAILGLDFILTAVMFGDL